MNKLESINKEIYTMEAKLEQLKLQRDSWKVIYRNKEIPDSYAPRGGYPWDKLEESRVVEDFKEFIFQTALKYDRSTNSIKCRVLKYLKLNMTSAMFSQVWED